MRLRNTATGVVVNVRDDKPTLLGWEPSEGTTSDGSAGYDDLTVAELKDEISRRNEDRDEDDRILVTGTKAELIERLSTDDEA